MERFIRTLDFDNVIILKEAKATRAAVDEFFVKLHKECEEHRERNSLSKFVFVAFYSGHG